LRAAGADLRVALDAAQTGSAVFVNNFNCCDNSSRRHLCCLLTVFRTGADLHVALDAALAEISATALAAKPLLPLHCL
jgi:hypothetical protein